MKKYLFAIAFFTIFFEVHSQEITMFSGFFDYQYYQDDDRISKTELVKLLETDPEAIAHWKRSKTFSTLTWVSLATSTGFLIWELSDNKPYENTSNNTITQIGVYSSLGAGLVFSILTGSQKKKSVLKYNSSIKEKAAFKVKPSTNGLGVTVVF